MSPPSRINPICIEKDRKLRNLNNSQVINQTWAWNKFLPLPWEFWPSEARLLLTLVGFWSIGGLLILGSASWWVATREMGDGAYYLKRQIIWLIASWSMLGFTISTSIRKWLKLAGPFLFLGCLLVGATLIIGSNVNGSSRWLIIGNLQIQPSELVKPFVILQAANLFAHWKRITLDQKLFWIGIFGTLILLILEQPNLSTASLIGIIIWLIAFSAEVNLLGLFSTALGGILAASISIFINEYQRLRIISFLDPWQDPQGNGYQLVQSLLAIGSGGFLGSGYGLSTQKLQYLPIQNTDFIFAVFAEEFGFVGSLMLLFFLLLIAFLGLRVALRSRTNQSKLISIGSTTILVGQAIINIAVAAGLVPTTGLPLPLVSYGGNSLISSLLISGLLIRCSLESTGLLTGYQVRRHLT